MMRRVTLPVAARTVPRRTVLKGLVGGAVGGRLARPRRDARAACELVEVYPGYPGYRRYITGLNGVGDHACLDRLIAMDPSFSRASQDAQNLAAARRLGIAGSMVEWT